MDEQLKFIIEQFEKNEINYWVDSGTLLGLVRDGKLIKGDNDIDIGIESSELIRFLKVYEDCFINKYNHKKYYYKNRVYKVKLFSETHKKSIDINLFYKNDDFFFCPQVIYNEIKKSSYFLRTIRRISTIILEMKSNKNIHYDKGLIKYFVKMGFWKIPSKYIEKTNFIKIDEININAPVFKEEYLTERYGDWRIPCKDWVFCRDDGLFINNPPPF